MKIKVMTYNLQSGLGTDGIYDWRRQAQVIKAEEPDVVGLEEVSVNYPRPGRPLVNLFSCLRDELAMFGSYGEALTTADGAGHYGIAALSRAPLSLMEKDFLPVPETEEQRVFLVVRVEAEHPYYLIVTHFSYQGEMEGDDEIRVKSAEMIMRTVVEKQYFPAIWVGDFNTPPTSRTIARIREEWDVCNDIQPDIPTAECSHAGWQQIDYICTYPKKAFKLQKLHFIDDLTASDHRPVTAELVLK